MGARITMYSTAWCGHCRRLKRQLDAEGIPYDEIDVDREEHQAYGERIAAKTGGYRTVPTVEVGGDLLVNPSLEQIRVALAQGAGGLEEVRDARRRL